MACIWSAIEKNENILISGGTSTGKTTLLNALAAFLPANDRIVLIEDTAELQIARPNLVRFEARREQADLPAIAIRDLLRATLRHRPDRIIVGEVRGGEATSTRQNHAKPFEFEETLCTGRHISGCVMGVLQLPSEQPGMQL